MAVPHFCLILFAFSILAEDSGGAGRGITWNLLNLTTLQINWDEKYLSELGVIQIEASATPIYIHGPVAKTKADVDTGNITLCGLLPSTYYELVVKAPRKSGFPIFSATYFTTVPDEGGKSTSSTMPNKGEEGATTSGAFALTFTISAILLACMGVVPA
ncbi:hypothetical protein ECG_08407 [Echinococcus granulosus]|uniref:EG95 n=1 Tax=Echinococcus granulosus TaxID=6210 RepID=W6U7Z5_ECHGR|nr:hypothetical protein EGR_10622 [Echinococcus granulosus]EUB54512.1 hypothetical protein EGR_10622 [Echinococcus granulosus]KAH9278807.1 hypothetical protein ECG_08407 [Echinococcus granulosus]